MPRNLRYKQQQFTKNIGKLIDFAYSNGYTLTFGDAYRDPRIFGKFGAKKSYSAAYSLHKKRLAIDLNLFKNGVYLKSTYEYKLLGDYWKSLNKDNVWGGDFKNNDGNHFTVKK